MIYVSLWKAYKTYPDLFDEFALPEQLEANRQDIIDNIILECSELDTSYPDFKFLKHAIGVWSRTRTFDWDYMCKVLREKYDPFISMERHEERLIESEGDSKSDTHSLNTGTSEHKTSAFDQVNDYSNREKDDTHTDASTVNLSDSRGKTSDIFDSKGDSALFTKQKITEQEVDNRMKYNITDIITNEFKAKFCLLIY